MGGKIVARVNLTGKWEVREAIRGSGKRRVGWTPARVPGCVQTDLLKAKRIPDPYVRRNELDTLWIDQADWEYRRTFRATRRQVASAMQHLVFEGLDTVAEVYLNGRRVGRSDNMFRRWRFDVAGQLREGENALRVVFRSPVAYGAKKLSETKCPLQRLTSDLWADRPGRLTYRPLVRKAQYQFGWDWGVMQITSGIWRPCYLETSDGATFDYVTTQQRHGKAGVSVEVTAHLLASAKTTGTLRISLGGQTVETKAALGKGGGRVTASVVVGNPKLWWPAGQGGQPLYRLEVAWTGEGDASASDTYETEIGLRTVELVQTKDAEGSTFKFRINGRDVFCKGANWIPDDVFPTRTTAARLEFLVDSALAANMNMLRVWGGGLYADETFLALCDRKGVMLWHDMMFACAAYPDDKWFLDNVEAEVRHQVRRMINHPSIVLWCGNNENQTAVDSWWADDPNNARLRKAYDRLTVDTEERVVVAEDPGRPWIPSSPTGCPREPGYPHGWEASGDMHDWSVWHGRKEFEYYLGTRPRFSSEFGFQSFPSVETLRTVMTAADMNVTSPVMEHHQRHRAGNSIINDFLTREFRVPGNFDDFCYLSQVNQGRAMKTAIEHWRRIKPRCMGTLYWQLNDDWPVASWSSIDWCLRWKALHYMARRFNAPLLGSVTDDDSGLRLWATSDVAEALRGTWRVEAWTFAGRRIWSKQGVFALKANASRAIARLPKQKILDAGGGAAGMFLVTTVRSGRQRSENTHLFGPIKRAELPKVRIRTELRKAGDAVDVRLTSDAPAFHVEVSTGRLAATMSDNILTLVPRRSVTVRITPRRPTTVAALKKQLKIRSVRDTY
jgi:beta-mannosidase